MRVLEFGRDTQQTGETIRDVNFQDWIDYNFTKSRVRECNYDLDYPRLYKYIQYLQELETNKVLGEEITSDQELNAKKIKDALDSAKKNRCYVVGEKIIRNAGVRKENIEYRELIPIDIDETKISFEEMEERCKRMGVSYCVHTTFKHTESYPRYRLLIPTDNKIYTEAQYRTVIEEILKTYFPEIEADNMGKRWAQKMYYPLVPKEARDHYKVSFRADLPFYHVEVIEKTDKEKQANLEAMLEREKRRVMPREKSKIFEGSLANPKEKPTWFGAVARAYTFPEAFEQIPALKRHYIKVTDTRYEYIHIGLSPEEQEMLDKRLLNPGVIVDDGYACSEPYMWAISFHDKDRMSKPVRKFNPVTGKNEEKTRPKTVFDFWCSAAFDGDQAAFIKWLEEGNDPKVRAEYDKNVKEWVKKNREINDSYYDESNHGEEEEEKKDERKEPGSIFVKRTQQRFNDRIFDPKKPKMISTGFKVLDEKLGGGLRIGLTVVGAEPSCGKSTFCLQIADYIAKKQPVLYVSLEMDAESLNGKAISRYTRKNNQNRDRWLSFDQITEHALMFTEEQMSAYQEAQQEYYDLKEIIVDSSDFIEEIQRRKKTETGSVIPDLTVKGIKYIVQQIKNITGEAPVVFVDYLQLLDLETTRKKADIRLLIDEAIKYLKTEIALAFNVPVVLISSLNRDAYNSKRDNDGKLIKKPGLSMTALKESGGLEYTAEVIILMSHYEDNGENLDDEQILFEIAKNRYGKKSVYQGNLVDLSSISNGPDSKPRLEGGFLLKFDKKYSYYRDEGQI